MDHHGEIDVVEVAEADQLRLAPEQLDPSGSGLGQAPLEIAAFLGRDGEEHHAPGQVIDGLRIHEGHGRSQHRGDLGVVAAGMDGARRCLRLGMPYHDQRVQLAQEREGRAVAAPASQLGPDARQGKSGARLETEPG
jgi:hypothetical protein